MKAQASLLKALKGATKDQLQNTAAQWATKKTPEAKIIRREVAKELAKR